MASEAEERFFAAWQEHGIQNGCVLHREYRPFLERKWKIDFALIPVDPAIHPVAIEIEGEGRHRRWGGFMNDMEKYNGLAASGWRIFRLPSHIVARDPEGAVDEIVQLVCGSVPEESVIR